MNTGNYDNKLQAQKDTTNNQGFYRQIPVFIILIYTFVPKHKDIIIVLHF